jgi:hypothetical protein
LGRIVDRVEHHSVRACKSEDLPAAPGATAPGGSSPRGMGVTLQPLRLYAQGAHRDRIGCTSAGGDHHAD